MNSITTPTNATAELAFKANHIGMALHLDNVVVSVVRNELKNNRIGGKVVTTRKFNTIGPKNIAELMKWLEEYCAEQPHQAVVESTYNWYWLSDEFEKRGWNLRLADPCTVSHANLKYANDYTDASYLAECLRNGSLRTAQIMDKESRAIRDLARYRMTLVADRSRLKTIVINMTANHLSIKHSADKFLKEIDEAIDEANEMACRQYTEAELEKIKGIEQDVDKALAADSDVIAERILAGYYDNRIIRMKVKSLLRRIRFLSDEVDELDVELEKLMKPNENALLLRTIKGCGPVLSTLIALEIGDINRFRRHKDFVSYCRLAPTAKLSNGKSKGMGNAKNGNAYLSWALTELATGVVRYNKEAKPVYDRLYNRSQLRVKAIRAMAAKLARAIFMMLKTGEVFDLRRCFGC